MRDIEFALAKVKGAKKKLAWFKPNNFYDWGIRLSIDNCKSRGIPLTNRIFLNPIISSFSFNKEAKGPEALLEAPTDRIISFRV